MPHPQACVPKSLAVAVLFARGVSREHLYSHSPDTPFLSEFYVSGGRRGEGGYNQFIFKKNNKIVDRPRTNA